MRKIFFKKFKNYKNGFTIIETMISVSLFLIIVMIGMGALLNANLLHQKSQDMRSILDNLSFTMEDMSRNLRTGYNYRCVTDSNGGLSNLSTPLSGTGCWGIAFKDQDGNQWIYYINTSYVAGGPPGIYRSHDGGASYDKLSPDEVNIVGYVNGIEISGFSVLGAEPPPGDSQQPFVTIRLIGTINSKGITTSFSLQTSVSQRIIDI